MKKVRLGEICDLKSGYAFKSSDYVSFSNTLNCRMSNIRPGAIFDINYNAKYLPDEYADKYKEFLLHDDDIIIAMTDLAGDPKILGVPARVITNGYNILQNQRVGKLIIKEKSKVNFNFLKYALSNPRNKEYYKKFAGGGLQINISNKDILNLEIPLYEIQEQIEISNKFDKVDKLIDIRKKQIEELDQLIKSQFVDMFGEPTINQKGFPLEKVEDIIDFQGGSQPDKKYFEYVNTENNIRLIQIRDYKTDEFVTYIPKKLAKKFCEEDDIMIGRYGPPIFQILQGIKGSYNVALMKAIPKKGNKEFIRYFLKQECLLHYLEGMSQRTAGQAGIEMPKLKSYPFPYPPIELQNQFAEFVKLIDKQKFDIQKSLEEIQMLQESLMNKYFGG